jgi:hypothetical protein
MLVLTGSMADERRRTAQLLGASLDGSQFRSASSLSSELAVRPGTPRFGVFAPQLRSTYNSELPYSLNDGALWAGNGMNLSVVAGAMLQYRRLRLIVAPELTYSQNRPYALADTGISPPVPVLRNPFSSPWHARAQSIDLPIRFGDQPFSRLGPGQSSLAVDAGVVTIGAATENEWWGPGIRNALILSNNAEGFPHLFLRTTRPMETPIGALEGRWLAGGLTESPYFDTDPRNDLRSITLLGVSLRPRGVRNIVIGVARSVFGMTDDWASALTSFPEILRNVGHPNAVPINDSTLVRGNDALTSVFARWTMSSSGLELYTEWARAELPLSVRDFLAQPTHSQGYTLGLQWLASPSRKTGGRIRVQAEGTYIEQSTTYRFRDIGSWYTSRSVVQGYTERGQPLGAAIGPGASSQWLAVDHLTPTWQVGAHLTRIRWLQDVRSQKSYEGDSAYCSQDVSLLPGVRASGTTPFGALGLDYSSGWRLNVFFEQRGNCFELPARDQRNRSLTLTFTPRNDALAALLMPMELGR